MASLYQRHPVESESDDNEPPAPPNNPPNAAANEDEGPQKLNIKFRFSGGAEVHFHLKMSTKLGRAMDAFAAKQQRDRGTLRFMFEGERIVDDTTPEELEMEDGDVVDVFTEQIGGS